MGQQIDVEWAVSFLRQTAAGYEEAAEDHRREHERTESQSVRAKKRAQARALYRAADALLKLAGDGEGLPATPIPSPGGRA